MWRKVGKARYDPAQEHPSRRAKRHIVDSLSCDVGTVLDLSTVGMRVECDGKPPLRVGSTGQMKLRIPEGSLAVTGRVVWISRVAFRKYQFGVEFVNVKRSVAAALDLLAQFGFIGEPTENTPSAPSGSSTKGKRKKRTVRAFVDLPDYYRVLGVKHNATSKEIQSAFRGLARKYHPDVTDDPEGPERFMRINEAYDVLKDKDQRKKYDARLAG